MAHGEERRQRLLAELEALPDEAMVPALVRSGLRPPAHLLARVAEYVAGRGFDPERRQVVAREAAGVSWQGRVLSWGDRLPAAEAHYVKHVLARGEWPQGTTVPGYEGTARSVVRDPDAGVMASKVGGRWLLTFMAKVPAPKGHRGSDWIVVEYDVGRGHWYTAYRAWTGIEHVIDDARREGIRWLRPLTNRQ